MFTKAANLALATLLALACALIALIADARTHAAILAVAAGGLLMMSMWTALRHSPPP